MEYNARKAFLDVKKSGINSKRDRDRYILLQEILKKIEGRAKLGEKSIIIEEPRVDWDFLIPVIDKLRKLGFTVDPRFPNAEDIMIREAKFNQEVFFVVAYIDWKKVSFTVNSTALLFHLIKKYL